jgi:hypothetical protein
MYSKTILDKKVSSNNNEFYISIDKSNESLLDDINKYKLEYAVYKLLKRSEHPITKSQVLDELHFLEEEDIEKLDIILSYYDFIHYNNLGYYYSKEEKTIDNNIIDVVKKIKYLKEMDNSVLVYNLFKSIGEPLKLHEITDYISIIKNIDENELKNIIEASNKYIIVGEKTYALAEWTKYKELHMLPEEKSISIHDKLRTSILKSIKSLKILNNYNLEYLVYKLLKNFKYSMTKSQIIDELYFLNDIDDKKLDVILSYYGFIHYNYKFGYYYSKKEKTVENHIFDIINKLKYLENIDIETCIYNLLNRLGQPMNLDEIVDYVNIFYNVNREQLQAILDNSSKFKSVGYKIYALNEWERYEEISYDFEKDLSTFVEKQGLQERDWEIYKKYVFNLQDFTLEELGNMYNITRERVRQIIKRIDRKMLHPTCKKKFKKYITLIESLIIENGVLSLDQNCYTEELKAIFGNRNLIEVIRFLNKVEDKFFIFENKYCCLKSKYNYVINYLDYLVKKIGESYASSKKFDDICDELKIKTSIEEKFLRTIIDNEKRFFVNSNNNTCYYSKETFDKYSLMWIILDEIGEPVHYSLIMEKYNSITGSSINSRTILSYLDRRKDLFVRVFTGIYALNEWGYRKHTHVTDLVVELLESKKSIMHYEDIYECIKDKTMAKKTTVYQFIQADERIASLGFGFYGLKSYIEANSNNLEYYSNIIEFNTKRRVGYILKKFSNEYGNTTIKYRVVQSMIDSYSIKIPKIFNIQLDNIIHLFDNQYNRYICKFDIYNNLYGIRAYFKRKEIKEGDILYLEIISKNIIRLLTNYEYEHEYEVFDYTKYSEYFDIENSKDEDNVIEIVDIDTLIKFGLQNGYVYYEDIEKIDISGKYNDIYELMIDLNERGITFLNKG